MAEDLTLNYRKWHEAQLLPGGGVDDVTKVRFFLGKHGPFEKTFPRDVKDEEIELAIRTERESIERLSRL